MFAFLESFSPSSLCLLRLASKADRSWSGNGQNQATRDFEFYNSLQGISRSSFESFADNLFFYSSLVPMVITHKTNSENRRFRNTNKVTQPCHPFRIQFCHQPKRTSNNNMNKYKKTNVKSDIHICTRFNEKKQEITKVFGSFLGRFHGMNSLSHKQDSTPEIFFRGSI